MESDFLKVAKQAALEAGKIIQKYSGKESVTVKNNDNSDLRTSADIKAEETIVEILTKHFPDHNIIGEEKTRIDKNSEYTWVIDPLDGTFSFLVGVPYVAVLIGLLKDKKPILGVIYDISTKDLYWAEKGKGAYMNGKPITVGKYNKLEDSPAAMDLGHRNTRTRKFETYVLPLLKHIGYIYSTGSSVSFGYVARGIYSAYIAEAWIWDIAGAVVIIREAGGKVTDFQGNEPDWSKERLQVVASNGLVHDQILEALNNKH